MTDLEKFNLHWKFEGQRAKATQEKYEQILFSIWKNHRDWKDDELHNGFQIKCWNRTFYKVVETAMKAGLLIMAGNYSVDNHTRIFHKNNVLFDMIFRDSQNKYGNWLDKIRKVKTDTEDIITQSYIYETDNIKIPYVETGLKNLIPKRRLKKLPYDIEKLYNLSNTMLPHYHQLLLRLNNAASNSKLKINSNFNLDDFKLKSFLYFDQQGLPKGRPWSYFCSTLNENKEHKRIDTGFEFRNDFLRKVGLGDYYEVYDIKSEIPRVNYLFHTGIWKDDDYDFYTEIIKDTEMLKYTGDEIERGTAGTKYYNDSMKQLFMRIYFGRGSDLQSYNAYIIEKKSRLENEYELWLFEKRLENGELVDFNLWEVICESTRKICGASIHNLVFWYAFFLETEVKIELLEREKLVYNVYDAFYYNQDIKDEIKDIIKYKATMIYNNYMKPINTHT